LISVKDHREKLSKDTEYATLRYQEKDNEVD
jgi:hypothetical protein